MSVKYASRRPKPEHLNPLAELIWDHLERTHETITDIAKRGGLPRQTVTAILYRPVVAQTPRPATLEALARGLRLSLELVRERAAYASMEYVNGDGATVVRADDWRADPTIARTMDCMRRLDDEGRRVVLATAHALCLGLPATRRTD